MSNSGKGHICWVVALFAEASIIIKNLSLKLFSNKTPFLVFKDEKEENWLVISGIGQVNVAAATIYLHQQSNAGPFTAWVNMGIAGGGNSTYGKAFLIDKVVNQSNGKVDYPTCAGLQDYKRAELWTFDKPVTNYSNLALFDMEGASFFQIASRLSTKDMVILLKVVSDNPRNDLQLLNSKTITRLIKKNLDIIISAARKIKNLSASEESRYALPNFYQIINKKWYFSEYQQHELKYLLLRWEAAFPNRNIFKLIKEENCSKSVMNKIHMLLEEFELDWDNI